MADILSYFRRGQAKARRKPVVDEDPIDLKSIGGAISNVYLDIASVAPPEKPRAKAPPRETSAREAPREAARTAAAHRSSVTCRRKHSPQQQPSAAAAAAVARTASGAPPPPSPPPPATPPGVSGAASARAHLRSTASVQRLAAARRRTDGNGAAPGESPRAARGAWRREELRRPQGGERRQLLRPQGRSRRPPRPGTAPARPRCSIWSPA